jgi:hypothetical protein
MTTPDSAAPPRILPPYVEKLIRRINSKDWWHVPPVDPASYAKRGKFLASTFREAEFWGRPNDAPERVTVANPLIGDEATIERTLLGRHESKNWPEIDQDISADEPFAARRYALDAKLYRAGRAKGYDAIVLLSPANFRRFKTEGRIPLSIELNLLTGEWESEPKPPRRPTRSNEVSQQHKAP